MEGSTGVFKVHADLPLVRRKGVARKVVGVEAGVFGKSMGLLDASALARALPAERATREGGFRDAVEAMALALLGEGVPLETINAATETVLDGYGNSV